MAFGQNTRNWKQHIASTRVSHRVTNEGKGTAIIFKDTNRNMPLLTSKQPIFKITRETPAYSVAELRPHMHANR
jgi:hypothetical protein